MLNNAWIYIAVMAGVTCLIRVLPLTLIRKEIKNQTIRSFLFYVRYVFFYFAQKSHQLGFCFDDPRAEPLEKALQLVNRPRRPLCGSIHTAVTVVFHNFSVLILPFERSRMRLRFQISHVLSSKDSRECLQSDSA